METHVRTTTPPRVVIVDVHASDSFREFASALRTRGVDVIHVRPPYTGRGSGFKRGVDALAGPVEPLEVDLAGDSPAAVEMRRRLLGAPTVDVHATEPVLAALSETSEWRANPALRKVGPERALLQVLDKWEASRLAHDAGVKVPQAWASLETDEFPIMVKGRLGVGGMFVRVAHDPGELAEAVSDFRSDGVEPFLERHHPHVTGVGTGGVCRDGRLLAVATYERLHDPEQPLAPSIAVRAYHDAEAEAATERLMAAIGYTGIFCLNFVPDAEGRPLLIDINTRAFGTWASLDLLGVPILDSYLELIGAGPGALPGQLDPARWLPVARVGHVSGGSWRDAWDETRTMGRVVLEQRPLLGWGWTAATELRVLQTGIQSAAAVLRSRRGR